MSIKLVAIDIMVHFSIQKKRSHLLYLKPFKTLKPQESKLSLQLDVPLQAFQNSLKELHLMDPGDYVITFNGGLVQETATGNELIKRPLNL